MGMLRRAFGILAGLSLIIFLAFAACGVRQQFANDQFYIYRWNPSTRSYSEYYFGWHAGNLGAHYESTTALASDNTAIVQWRARPSNLRIVHEAYGLGGRDEGPLVWGDHYYSTPSFGINQNGLAENWTLEFRLEGALFLFAIVPLIWGAMWLRRWRLARQSRKARGFAVVAASKVGDVDAENVAEEMPVRSGRRFLARPMWRDYVFAFVLIGIGFIFSDGSGRWAIRLPALTLFAAGCVIFVCAVGWSLWSTLRTGHMSRPQVK
jgi:hypothetical protein